MLRRIATASLSLLALLAPIERVPAQRSSARQDLERQFAAANRDRAAVVPLILAGSAAIASIGGEDARLLADTLDPYASRVFFTPGEFPGAERLGIATHVVRQGEVGTRIAQRYGIGAGLLRYLNADYDERRLRVGQRLKVLDLSDRSLRIVVEKSRYRLLVWRDLPRDTQDLRGPQGPQGNGPILVACFPVGLGAPESPTPEGRTTIEKRVLDPEWTHPVTRQVFPSDDPRNVLGGYWIALDPMEKAGSGGGGGIGRSGIGLHGYTGEVAANWIEQPASHGCVRMLQPHIDRVFHLALEGTPVTIVP